MTHKPSQIGALKAKITSRDRKKGTFASHGITVDEVANHVPGMCIDCTNRHMSLMVSLHSSELSTIKARPSVLMLQLPKFQTSQQHAPQENDTQRATQPTAERFVLPECQIEVCPVLSSTSEGNADDYFITAKRSLRRIEPRTEPHGLRTAHMSSGRDKTCMLHWMDRCHVETTMRTNPLLVPDPNVLCCVLL